MNTLDKILAHKRTEVEQRARNVTLQSLQSQCVNMGGTRQFIKALQEKASAGRAAVIAEIKKASPSKGLIRADFDPQTLANSYLNGGATCLSVLTDEAFFQGSDDYLAVVRDTVPLPILRKDFIVDAYQVWETRAMGADCLLLIVAALDQPVLESLYELASQLGLDVLVEVHNEEELHRALALSPRLIGINNRNLKTFETTINTTISMLPTLAASTGQTASNAQAPLLVTESGIGTREDIETLREVGISCFLIGETFMRADDPGESLQTLFTGHL